MPRRPLGQTGLEVSVLGFGASPLGGVFQVARSIWVVCNRSLSRLHGPLLAQSLPPPPPPLLPPHRPPADRMPTTSCRQLTRTRVWRP